MGNRATSNTQFQSYRDVLHTISPTKRVEYLVFGYFHSMPNIPDGIRFLCVEYLQNMNIASITEKREEYKRSKTHHKICLLGGGAVGMSAIVVRFIFHEFPNYYDPTIEDSYRHTMMVDDTEHTLEILDTAGQNDFQSMWPGWIRDNEVFILCYSVISSNTFHHLDTVWQSILDVKGTDCDYQPVAVLCGNKADAEDEREVTKQQGMRKAKQWNIPFLETSARTGENIDLLFEIAVKQIQQHKEKLVSDLL